MHILGTNGMVHTQTRRPSRYILKAERSDRDEASKWSYRYCRVTGCEVATFIGRTLPPVLLARQETTTSTGRPKAVRLMSSTSVTFPNTTSAPGNSCTTAVITTRLVPRNEACVTQGR